MANPTVDEIAAEAATYHNLSQEQLEIVADRLWEIESGDEGMLLAYGDDIDGEITVVDLDALAIHVMTEYPAVTEELLAPALVEGVTGTNEEEHQQQTVDLSFAAEGEAPTGMAGSAVDNFRNTRPAGLPPWVTG